jgi:hypothetical protein
MTTDQRMHELEEQFQELAVMQKTLMSKMSETNDQMLLLLRALLGRIETKEKSDDSDTRRCAPS